MELKNDPHKIPKIYFPKKFSVCKKSHFYRKIVVGFHPETTTVRFLERFQKFVLLFFRFGTKKIQKPQQSSEH